jgi:hypothetical protein
VTKGSLEFTMDDEATGGLTGSVAIDKSVKNDIRMHYYVSKIKCESGSSLSFQVTNMDELENICEDEVSGTIQRVAKRQAVRYMSEGEDAIAYQREYAQSIQFENTTEAQWTVINTNHFCGCPTTGNFQRKSRDWSGDLRLLNHYPFSSLRRRICC